jgi:hypothetical protein
VQPLAAAGHRHVADEAWTPVVSHHIVDACHRRSSRSDAASRPRGDMSCASCGRSGPPGATR